MGERCRMTLGGAAGGSIPRVMETGQVPRRLRVRLLLLLLLLVPWVSRPASGVVLPPAGVFSLRAAGRAWAGAAAPQSRRSLALADDAAFRERARLLAALERRHWLNSYMHKLLVLDAR
ncbi:Tuberoinfundibular peptide of 39 residues containing protein [Galemys pyrenaicus]|uniref:Tuberoinfundibular peptide of 39 residues n=1 Tax=Galemys pyrenaicus TaxID=202257 RepID=A0A8J6DWZ9_GALPY|nr:Tuberoinfundibular peptide of 39 residues containing protein [Galemys pyrenaicus]